MNNNNYIEIQNNTLQNILRTTTKNGQDLYHNNKKEFIIMFFSNLLGQTERNICEILKLSSVLYDEEIYLICIACIKTMVNSS